MHLTEKIFVVYTHKNETDKNCVFVKKAIKV